MKSCLIACLLALASLMSAAATVAGTHVDDTAHVAGQDIPLNGAGVRVKWGFIKMYVGALYTEQKAKTGDAVLQDAHPRRMTLTLLRTLDADHLHESLMDGLEANCTSAEMSDLDARLKELNGIFQAVRSVNAGDVITLDFIPGKGTQITVRGQLKDVIAGDDFSRALLKVWFGKKPVSVDLKSAMLGGK
ncbi:MAG: chalcone isomerase family protein [Burkholderiales bacterium]|nr:chalcone isomerase family protein [Burkholderiales bacterium]